MKKFAKILGAKEQDLPKWLLEANIQNAVITVAGGEIIWENGIWLNGDWYGYVWKNGIWKSGNWKKGRWVCGFWLRGEWHTGDWVDGVWMTGVWKSGTHLGGIWYDGVWVDGLWDNGEWYKGKWYGGLWVDGMVLGQRTNLEIKEAEDSKARTYWEEYFGEGTEDEPARLPHKKELLGMSSSQIRTVLSEFGVAAPTGGSWEDLVVMACKAFDLPTMVDSALKEPKIKTKPHPLWSQTPHIKIDEDGVSTALTKEMEGIVKSVNEESDKKIKDKRRAEKKAKRLAIKKIKEKREREKPVSFGTSQDLANHLFGGK